VKSASVIGDADYRQDVRERKPARDQENISDTQILELITAHFKVNPRLLIAPHGWEEKHFRRKLIRYLVDEIGLKPARIMRLCHITRMTVQNALLEK
jgi:hypothetical protein